MCKALERPSDDDSSWPQPCRGSDEGAALALYSASAQSWQAVHKHFLRRRMHPMQSRPHPRLLPWPKLTSVMALISTSAWFA